MPTRPLLHTLRPFPLLTLLTRFILLENYPMSRFVAGSATLAVLTGVATLIISQPSAAGTIDYVHDRSTVYSSINMCRPISSGESLADIVPPGPSNNCLPESHVGDINVEFTWADSTVLSGVWSPNASGVLPGASVDGSGHSALITETGDTFNNPWTLANNTSASDIVKVVMSALGTPDMGFDTDDGTNPNHGEAGFDLYLDISSAWDGDLTVTYDWWNNWNGTTDIFHRMTLDFAVSTPLVQGANMVFYQDTDEIPLPASPTLMLLGLALLARVRRDKQYGRLGRA